MTFLPRQSIYLFLCLSATIAAQKNGGEVKITVKQGRICMFGRGGKLETGVFKKMTMDENGDAEGCEDLCRTKLPKCKGFQVKKKSCLLLKYPVYEMKKMTTNNKQLRKQYVCARVGDKPTLKPTPQPTDKPVVPTASPTNKAPVTNRPTKSPVTKAPVTNRPTKSPVTSSPTAGHGKEFFPKKNVQCHVSPKDGFSKDNGLLSYGACDNKCGRNNLCMAYTWVPKNEKLGLGKCTAHNFWPNTLKRDKEGSYCVRVAKPTDAPVPPSPKPTNKPTDKPTSMTCNIEVTLGFPFKNPDDAPYYGQHADWVEVSKLNHKDSKICSAFYEDPTWCKYKNSVKDGDSAYVDNYEDEYYTDEQLKAEKATRETVIIRKATEHVTQVEVYHWLFAEDYYPSLQTWNDHMMAPQLEITNLSHQTQKAIGDKSGQKVFQHPVNPNIPSHIKSKGKWIGNPKYTGNFKLEIACNKFCYCEVQKRKNFGGFFE